MEGVLVPRGDRPVDVVALGENSLDFVAVCGSEAPVAGKQPLEAFRLEPGGQMATAALACGRLGLRTRYIGAFGTDEWGALARAPLDAAGIEVLAPPRSATAASRVAVIVVDASGERRVFEHRPASLTMEADAILPRWIAEARVLLVDATQPAAAVRAVELARQAGTATICDVDRPGPATDALLESVDIAVVPEALAVALTGEHDPVRALEGLAATRARRASVVIATCGERGSVCRAGDRTVVAPGHRVRALDTTGAGDAFRAGLAAGLLRLGPTAALEQVLGFANAVAALNCRRPGAQAGLPTYEEAQALAAGREGAGSGPLAR